MKTIGAVSCRNTIGARKQLSRRIYNNQPSLTPKMLLMARYPSFDTLYTDRAFWRSLLHYGYIWDNPPKLPQ